MQSSLQFEYIAILTAVTMGLIIVTYTQFVYSPPVVKKIDTYYACELTIGICISQGPKTLWNTLRSYQAHGLFDASDEIIIFIQNRPKNGALEKIAASFRDPRIKIYGRHNNSAYLCIKDIAALATCRNMLFLEEDWELIQGTSTTKSRLLSGISLLNSNTANVVRYRSRWNGGSPNWSKIKWKSKHKLAPYHTLQSLHWENNPDLVYPKRVWKCNNDYYCATSPYASYTLNPIMFPVKWWMIVMQPYLAPTKPGVQAEASVLDFWMALNITIAQGEGLFKHNRIDR